MQQPRRGITSIVPLLAIALLGSATTGAESLEEQLTAYLDQARASQDTPGLSAAVSHAGTILFAGGSGHADLNHLIPATAHTVYNIGSVSKANAVVAVMQLVGEGKIDLDAPIQNWVSDFPEQQGSITLRHILTHTSGIRHYRPGDFGGETFRENLQRFDSVDQAIDLFADDPLLFTPGEFWSYSSYATNLLQAVIETTSGTSFEAYMRTRVWEPAGMLGTAFDIPERIVRHRARSYRRDEDGRRMHEPYGDITYKFAGGGMISTVLDQVRLGIALNHRMLLDDKSLAAMYRPWPEPKRAFSTDPEREPRDLPFQQALIWRVEEDARGRTFVHHGGSVIGFRASLVNYPAEDLVVAVMMNSAGDPHRISRAIARMLLERIERFELLAPELSGVAN